MWAQTLEETGYGEIDLSLYIEPTAYFAELSQEAATELVYQHYAYYIIPAAEWYVCRKDYGPALVWLMHERGYTETIVMQNPEVTITLVGRVRQEVRQP